MKLEEIATPVSFTGFSAATLERFAPQLRELGMDPRQGTSGGGSVPDRMGDLKNLEPGSMISVQLLSGDMSVSADGTVTAIDGNHVYAFGHRFLDSGPTDLPFARAEVLALLPDISNSFKISQALEWMGTITQDRNTAVSGVAGKRAALVPIEIRSGRQDLSHGRDSGSRDDSSGHADGRVLRHGRIRPVRGADHLPAARTTGFRKRIR